MGRVLFFIIHTFYVEEGKAIENTSEYVLKLLLFICVWYGLREITDFAVPRSVGNYDSR